MKRSRDSKPKKRTKLTARTSRHTDPARWMTIARARAGELLNNTDLQVIFRLKKSQFHNLLKVGAFESFKVMPAISNYCYSGTKVVRYLNGELIAVPFGTARRKRIA